MTRNVIILAAGKGTRMKSEKAKVLHEVAGKSMLAHVIDNTRKVAAVRTVIVVGFNSDAVIDSLPEDMDLYVEQKEQLGTGHAVLETRAFLEQQEGTTMVTYGDMPLITGETLASLFDFHEKSQAATTVLTGIATNPFGYGRIIRENGKVVKIVEEKDASDEERQVHEINTGIYVFDNKLLFEALSELTPSNAQGEYYLTDVIEIFVKDGRDVQAVELKNFDECLGVNDRAQLAVAEKIMRHRINQKHMLNGVTLRDPENTYIEADVKIGADTVIEAGVVLAGRTEIDKKCLITTGSRIVNSRLHSNVTVNNSTVEDSTMEAWSNCGPYAHLRPGTILHEEVHVGNFVEVKASSLGRGTKAGHLTYIGNATVGEKVNFGAGTITANYNGKEKFNTEIDDYVFTGSNSTLIAPIYIGKNALTAAGSTITEDVPEDAVAFGRARQVNKIDMAKRFPHYRGE